jgi:hypothetical protein
MRNRGFLEIIGVLVLAGLVLAVVAGAAVMGGGTLRVEVREKGVNGTHVFLPVPVNLVRIGMNFVPERELDEARAELEPWMPAVRAILLELANGPDGTLVEVEDGAETVHIVKRGGELIIDVDTPDETVHLAVPLMGVGSLIDQFYGEGPSV